MVCLYDPETLHARYWRVTALRFVTLAFPFIRLLNVNVGLNIACMSRPYTLYCRNQLLVLTQNSKQDHYYTRHILDFPISLYRAPLQKEFNAVKKIWYQQSSLKLLNNDFKVNSNFNLDFIWFSFLYDYEISLEYNILKFHILIFFPDTHWFILDQSKW